MASSNFSFVPEIRALAISASACNQLVLVEHHRHDSEGRGAHHVGEPLQEDLLSRLVVDENISVSF